MNQVVYLQISWEMSPCFHANVICCTGLIKFKQYILVSVLFEMLTTLKNHQHVLISAFLFWEFVYLSSGWISYYISAQYRQLNKRNQRSWKSHCVSFLHAVIICILALPVQFSSNLKEDRLFGYDPYAGNVYAIACGYFLWDTLICLYDFHGVPFALHGVACFFVFIFSFTPFLNYYGASFLLFELSTPFLNIHWFCDKLKLTGSRIHVTNGYILLWTFFLSRIVFGFYSSYFFWGIYFILTLGLLSHFDYSGYDQRIRADPVSFEAYLWIFKYFPLSLEYILVS